jgi:hypothetical protein
MVACPQAGVSRETGMEGTRNTARITISIVEMASLLSDSNPQFPTVPEDSKFYRLTLRISDFVSIPIVFSPLVIRTP